MTELRWHWYAQAQLKRDKFLETLVYWAGVASLVGGCLEDGKSFIPVSGIRLQSVSQGKEGSLALPKFRQ